MVKIYKQNFLLGNNKGYKILIIKKMIKPYEKRLNFKVMYIDKAIGLIQLRARFIPNEAQEHENIIANISIAIKKLYNLQIEEVKNDNQK